MSLFYFFGGDGTDRAGLGVGYIPRRWRPQHPSAPGHAAHDRQQGKPYKTRHTRPKAGHAAPVCTRYQTGRAGQIVPAAGRWMAWSASDRARPNGQNYCKQKYLFFMRKPLDKRNKIVYNIDSKQTYLHTTTTGGRNHDEQ